MRREAARRQMNSLIFLFFVLFFIFCSAFRQGSCLWERFESVSQPLRVVRGSFKRRVDAPSGVIKRARVGVCAAPQYPPISWPRLAPRSDRKFIAPLCARGLLVYIESGGSWTPTINIRTHQATGPLEKHRNPPPHRLLLFFLLPPLRFPPLHHPRLSDPWTIEPPSLSFSSRSGWV